MNCQHVREAPVLHVGHGLTYRMETSTLTKAKKRRAVRSAWNGLNPDQASGFFRRGFSQEPGKWKAHNHSGAQSEDLQEPVPRDARNGFSGDVCVYN